MLEVDLDEDTHLCIKCNMTIVGLENYIVHRKSNCIDKRSEAINRDIIHTDHSYQTFDFTENSKDDEKQFHFNYDIETDHHHGVETNSEDVIANGKDANVYKDHSTKSLNKNYAYNYGLEADDFFSLLNLQSSSKNKLKIQTTGGVSVAMDSPKLMAHAHDKLTSEKSSSAVLSHGDNDDDWIDVPTTSGTEKLMKAVKAISGNKHPQTPRSTRIYNYEFGHDSPEPPFDDDDDAAEDDDYTVPPQTHTGGKWKPSERSHRSILHSSSSRWYERWDLPEDSNNPSTPGSNEDLLNEDSHPPPSYTKGKWVPGTKIIKLDYKRDPEPMKIFSEQFWCNSCNRKLSSRSIYERHLRSNLHIKRSQPEQELECAFLPLPRIDDIVKQRKAKMDSSRNDSIMKANINRKPNDKTKFKQSQVQAENKAKVKRNRRCSYVKCNICKTRLRENLFGKHLISHYHYRRMLKNPEDSFETILQNMSRIVLQSPFQCHPCRFYANTEGTFARHWMSSTHISVTDRPGRFWCSFCRFQCEDNNQMHQHLVDSDHQEVVRAINRSVPIIIRKRINISCDKCLEEFQYNIELKKHASVCTKSVPAGTASKIYQDTHRCNSCSMSFKSTIAFQRHFAKIHSNRMFFCRPCGLTFENKLDVRKHRVSLEHKVKAVHINQKVNLKRKCQVCGEILDDVLKLKTHLKTEHPNDSYPCYFCGEKFTMSQELSRHVRDKVCRLQRVTDTLQDRSSNPEILEALSLRSTITSMDLPVISSIPTNLVTASILATLPTSSPIPEISSFEEHTLLHADANFSLLIDDRTKVMDDEQRELYVLLPKTNSTERLWGCKQCEFRTPTEAECIFHEMLHKWDISKNAQIPCPMCNKMFGKNSLRCHLRLHTNDRIFKCTHCSSAFIRKQNLKDHFQRAHTPHTIIPQVVKETTPNASFTCILCPKSFKRRILLDQHMHCHREQVSLKVFKCPQVNCLFRGRSAAELRSHQITHSTDQNYCCNVDGCNYKTKTLTLLKRHNRSQHDSNSTPNLQCPECSFTTKLTGHLKRHIRVHSGERPFKCPYCDYACNNSENLRKHVISTKLHPGRSLYECQYCTENDEQFATNIFKEFKVHLAFSHEIMN